MPFAQTLCRGSVGIDAPLVTVETHISNGLPKFTIVGLPEAAVKESKDRVRSALLNSFFEFPAKHITINLAPADLPKEGGRFDLSIAIGILIASGQLDANHIDDYEFGAELGLGGEVRGFCGALPFAIQTHIAKRKLILSPQNAEEASLCESLTLLPAKTLRDVAAHLSGKTNLSPFSSTRTRTRALYTADMKDVKGQLHAKRALEIAAAGGHNLMYFGPPGTGKTMLTSRLPTIMPPLCEQEALEVASLHSIGASGFNFANWRQRPFRSPHHTSSGIALVGGGASPKPGEISLAHRGVLFLDELPEFSRKVLDVLREPLESGKISIARAARTVEYPAEFQLVAAMNPCPCGYYTDPQKECQCSPAQIQRYLNRVSGPFLDRIDLVVEVPALKEGELLSQDTEAESSADIQARVVEAVERQQKRQSCINSQMATRKISKYCKLTIDDENFLKHAVKKLGLSARATHRLLKLARTIADLQGTENLEQRHLLEALSFRRLEKLSNAYVAPAA